MCFGCGARRGGRPSSRRSWLLALTEWRSKCCRWAAIIGSGSVSEGYPASRASVAASPPMAARTLGRSRQAARRSRAAIQSSRSRRDVRGRRSGRTLGGAVLDCAPMPRPKSSATTAVLRSGSTSRRRSEASCAACPPDDRVMRPLYGRDRLDRWAIVRDDAVVGLVLVHVGHRRERPSRKRARSSDRRRLPFIGHRRDRAAPRPRRATASSSTAERSPRWPSAPTEEYRSRSKRAGTSATTCRASDRTTRWCRRPVSTAAKGSRESGRWNEKGKTVASIVYPVARWHHMPLERDRDRSERALDREAHVQDVAFRHLVVLALDAELAGRLGGVHGAGGDQFLVADHLGADEAAFQVGVDHA